ncbi:MAG: GNAT family N-acetyltransferase, partial [Candidatus Auribacterota bacterium]|nr:GNAT family N-acetyltransferase [Candidatus Auribacterota bacterium]
ADRFEKAGIEIYEWEGLSHTRNTLNALPKSVEMQVKDFIHKFERTRENELFEEGIKGVYIDPGLGLADILEFVFTRETKKVDIVLTGAVLNFYNKNAEQNRVVIRVVCGDSATAYKDPSMPFTGIGIKEQIPEILKYPSTVYLEAIDIVTNRPIGYAVGIAEDMKHSGECDKFYLMSVAVLHENYQGKGTGLRLFREMAAIAKVRGFHRFSALFEPGFGRTVAGYIGPHGEGKAEEIFIRIAGKDIIVENEEKYVGGDSLYGRQDMTGIMPDRVKAIKLSFKLEQFLGGILSEVEYNSLREKVEKLAELSNEKSDARTGQKKKKQENHPSPIEPVEEEKAKYVDVEFNGRVVSRENGRVKVVDEQGRTVGENRKGELNELFDAVSFDAHAPPSGKDEFMIRNGLSRKYVKIVITSSFEETKGSVTAISRDGETLFIHLFVLGQMAAITDPLERKDFILTIKGIIEGHEDSHIKDISMNRITDESKVCSRDVSEYYPQSNNKCIE